MPKNLTHLHQSIVRHYNLEELRTLCFNLGINYDDLGGEGLSAKTRELVLRLGRNKRFDKLLTTLRQNRPEIALFVPTATNIGEKIDTDTIALKTLYAELSAFERTSLSTPAAKERTKLFLATSVTIVLVCVVIVLVVLIKSKSTPTSMSFSTNTPVVTLTPLAAATARPGEVLVLVAEFKGEADYDPSTWIFSRLESDLKDSAMLDARIEQVSDILKTADEAQALGQRYGATLVIWGTYDKFGIWPHYKVVHGQHLVSVRIELAETANLPSEPDRFALYITREMGSQLSYLSLFTLGQIAYFSQEYDHALTFFDKALSLQPEGVNLESSKAMLHFFRGYIYQVFEGDLQSAIIEYSNGLKFASDNPSLYFNRGLCYAQLGQYKKAIQDFDQVIQQDEFFAEVYFNRANAHTLLGDYTAATADFNKAIEQRPDDVNALYGRGVIHLLSQNNEEAIDDFDMIISLEPTHIDAHYGRGFAHAELGEYDRAIADYNDMIDLDPQNANVYNELAWLYADTLETNLNQAIKLAEKAIELAEEQSLDDSILAGFLDTLGWAYFKQGDIESAEVMLLRAIDLHPGQEIREHLRKVKEKFNEP